MIELKDFCHFDSERNCYVISNDYNMYIERNGDLLEWEKVSDKDNPRSWEDKCRIDYAFFGSQIESFRIEELSELADSYRSTITQRGRTPFEWREWVIVNHVPKNPIFKKIIRDSIELQNITLGQFMSDDEILIELKNRFENKKLEFLRGDNDLIYSQFNHIASLMVYSYPNREYFYKDLRRKYHYREDLYPSDDIQYDISIETKDRTYFINSNPFDLYDELYPLFTKGIIKHPCSYSETFNGQMDSKLYADQYETDIRDCIDNFNRMMDEEGGWENID